MPFVHMRIWDAQLDPCGTEDDWYAVILAPCATAAPLNEHDAADPTVHVAEVYVPESVPLVHVRV